MKNSLVVFWLAEPIFSLFGSMAIVSFYVLYTWVAEGHLATFERFVLASAPRIWAKAKVWRDFKALRRERKTLEAAQKMFRREVGYREG